MRLFKFLVIPNKLINNSSGISPKIFLKGNREINLKNKLYVFNNSNIGLMKIDYPNENIKFGEEHSAYIVIDANKYSDIMNLISSLEKESNRGFVGCDIKFRESCEKIRCHKESLCIDIDLTNRKNVRGTIWSFSHDTKGTRHKFNDIFYDIKDSNGYTVVKERKIEPRTGGIVYSCLQWPKNKRPEKLKKPVYIPLQHWVKCHSIPINAYKDDKENNKDDKEKKKKEDEKVNSYYHMGHIFDYRSEFIGNATNEKQRNIRKNKEPKAGIYRGERVLGGQYNFAEELNCTCSKEEGNKQECRKCEGVLYIANEEKLIELYNQLISDDYKKVLEI